ncbi:MAG: hypothetical protein ACM3YE_08015 [Bacteroidota bacterium]
MKLIKGSIENIETKPDLSFIYLRNLHEKVTQFIEQPENRDIFKQIIYFGVKFINSYPSYESRTYEWLENMLNFSFALQDAIGKLTPSELLTIFPIEKEYDGKKYGIKDYFYSMKTIREIGLNNVIGDRVNKLLWDYWNWDIDNFVVNMMCFLSGIRQLEGETSVMEEFSELLGLTTYTLFKGTNGHEYLQHNSTGKIQRVRTQKASYLRTVPNRKGVK